MNKLLKILPIMMVVCMIFVSVFSNIYAVGTEGIDDVGSRGTASEKVKTVAYSIWRTVATIVQILAVAAVVFAGLRYMFASADAKADIKKSMGILAIGGVLVFGATLLINFIFDLTTQVLEK